MLSLSKHEGLILRQAQDEGFELVELLRTNNVVLISWLTALMADNGIAVIILDTHASILEGSALAIPRRIMVADEDFERARRIHAVSLAHFIQGHKDVF
jgi:hypothetical protein